jgi:phage-related protein
MALLPFTPAAMQIIGIIGDLINAWAPFIAQMVGVLLPVAGQVLNAFKPLGPVFAALGPILAVLGQAFAIVLTALLQALAPILIALTPLIQQVAVAFAANLVSAIQALTPFLVGLANMLANHPKLVMGVVTAIGVMLSAWNLFKSVVLALTGPLMLIRLAMMLLGVTFKQLLAPVWSVATTIGGWISKLAGAFSEVGIFRLALNLLGQAFSFLFRSILGAIGPIGWLIIIFTTLFASNEQLRQAVYRQRGEHHRELAHPGHQRPDRGRQLP